MFQISVFVIVLAGWKEKNKCYWLHCFLLLCDVIVSEFNYILFLQVSLPVVRRFVQAVSEKAVGVGLIRGVRPDQQLVKVGINI